MRSDSLYKICNLENIMLDVVDIGANPVDGDPPYKKLLLEERVNVCGFDSDAAAYQKLMESAGRYEKYFPYAVGDGTELTFYTYAASGLNSLFELDQEMGKYFWGFEQWGVPIKSFPVQTRRLDNITEITNIDMLKIDVQGAEKMIIENGIKKLESALLIQTEIEFFPLYKNQPLFSDVDLLLRNMGFILHTMIDVNVRAVRPLNINNDASAGVNQFMWADAVYIRDFRKFSELATEKLLKLAILTHDIYRSYDIALHCLTEYDKRMNTNLMVQYAHAISG